MRSDERGRRRRKRAKAARASMVKLRGRREDLRARRRDGPRARRPRPRRARRRRSRRSWARRARASRRCSTSSPASIGRRRGPSRSAGKRLEGMSEGALAQWRVEHHRLRLPVVQPAARAHRGRERRAAAPAHEPRLGASDEARAQTALRVVGLEDRMQPLPAPALRRAGAARRHRARHRQRPDDHRRRRADRRPRSQERRRDPDAPRQAQHASSARRSSWSRTTRRPPSGRRSSAASTRGSSCQ